jgi:hypothetical protein
MHVILFTYSYPRSFKPRLTISFAAVRILVELISQPNAFHEFQPRAGSLPCFELVNILNIMGEKGHTTPSFLTRAFADGSKGSTIARDKDPSIMKSN